VLLLLLLLLLAAAAAPSWPCSVVPVVGPGPWAGPCSDNPGRTKEPSGGIPGVHQGPTWRPSPLKHHQNGALAPPQGFVLPHSSFSHSSSLFPTLVLSFLTPSSFFSPTPLSLPPLARRERGLPSGPGGSKETGSGSGMLSGSGTDSVSGLCFELCSCSCSYSSSCSCSCSCSYPSSCFCSCSCSYSSSCSAPVPAPIPPPVSAPVPASASSLPAPHPGTSSPFTGAPAPGSPAERGTPGRNVNRVQEGASRGASTPSGGRNLQPLEWCPWAYSNPWVLEFP